MGRLAQTEGLTEEQEAILEAVRDFVDNEIIPVANDLEHADEYPKAIVDGLKEMGVFGLMIPEEYGGLGVTANAGAAGVAPPVEPGLLRVTVVDAKDLSSGPDSIKPYVVVRVGEKESKTKHAGKTTSPEW